MSEEIRVECFTRFYAFITKNEQDTYLQTLISPIPVERRRSRIFDDERRKIRISNLSYSLNTSSGYIKV